MVAGIIGAAILIVVVFGVRACNNNRRESALKDYNRQVANIGTESRQTGEQFFKQMDQASQQSPAELYQAILGYRGSADQSLKQAKAFSVPDEMKAAQQSLLIALELRRNALDKVAGDIRPALGDEGEAADRAITDIAGEMRSLDASDVLYNKRVIPFIQDGLKKAEIGGQDIPKSEVMREISWVAPTYVAQKLDQQISSGKQDGGADKQHDQPTGPGLHGTGLNATSYGNVTLSPSASNQLTYVKGQPFTVSFTNQGENNEFGVKVTLKIARKSGTPITISKTVPQVAQGQKATVELPLNREPPLDTVLTISVAVGAVPGEKKTDNNKSSYPTLFVAG